MLNKSELRNACYRAKKGVQTEKHQKYLDAIEPLLNETQTWENFPIVWDVMINKADAVVVIKPESDYDYVHSTLIEAALYSKRGITFDSFDDRQMNIITQVESLKLDGIMTWENYNKVWGVDLDQAFKTISTKLYNVKSGQIEVTDEMIEASKKDADGAALNIPEPNVLQSKPMTTTEVDSFKTFLSKKYK